MTVLSGTISTGDIAGTVSTSTASTSGTVTAMDTSGGTNNYEDLNHKPSINGVVLIGDINSKNLNLESNLNVASNSEIASAMGW